MRRLVVPWWGKIIIAVLCLALLAGVLLYDQYTQTQEEKNALLFEQERRESMQATDDNSVNIVQKTGFTTSLNEGGQLLLGFDDFLDRYERISNVNNEAGINLDASDLNMVRDGDDFYLLRFKMRACESAAVVRVDFGEKHDFYLTTEWREYYYPCYDKEISNVKWRLKTDFQIVQLSDVEIYKYKKSETDLQMLNCGSYLSDTKNTILSEDKGLQFGKDCRDIQYYNGYVYAIGAESLFIAKENEDGTLEMCQTLNGLGEVRRLEIYDDSMVAVASRHNGVFLIDVVDKYNPQIISRYYTLEIANDVCFTGKYMIVAGRYFGVEIVDIQDRRNPRYVAKIANSKECYRVASKDSTLYVSSWADGIVEIYDISVINVPQKIGAIKVDGRCAEAYIDGDNLYVVTGYKAMNQNDSVGKIGYATGNGLTIYDISNREKPQWLSTIKADGSLLHSGFDDWSVCVSNGIAVFTNSYGGLYIYDVSDVSAPKRVSKVSVPLYRGIHKTYADMSGSNSYVFPYDCVEYINSPVTGVAIGKGKIYFSCAYSDTYAIDYPDAIPLKYDREPNLKYILSAEERTNSSKQVSYYLEDENVYTIKKSNEQYYVGTENGIIILDAELRELFSIPTDNPVQDIAIVGNYMYTAETSGMGIYKIETNDLVKTAFYTSEVRAANISSIAVTSDENYAVLQASFTAIETVDIRDKDSPVRITQYINAQGNAVSLKDVNGTGSLYYRNIVNGVVEDTIGVIGSTNSLWFKSLGDQLQVVKNYKNDLYREEGGSAAIGDGKNILSVCKRGYVVYNPLTIKPEELAGMQPNRIQNISMSGKATVSGDTLVVCNAYKGIIWIVNVHDITSPVLLGSLETAGNPDLCLIEDNFVLVPVRHMGLMKIVLREE